MCVHFWATKDRYLCRCRSASFFRRIRTAQSGQYLARLDFGVNMAPHTAQRFTPSRLLLIGGGLSIVWGFIFATMAYEFSGKDMVWTYVVWALGAVMVFALHLRARYKIA